jgi:hypothetical protein
MLVPLLIVAGGLILIGIFTGDIVEHIIRLAVPKGVV